jgi:heme exporter protein A
MLTARNVFLERFFEPVFEPASLEVGPGQLLLVTGANGSGKTTLIRMLAGVLEPSGGDITVTASLAYVGHSLAVKSDLSVHENLAFMQTFLGRPDVDLEAAIGRLGLRGQRDQLARTLSAGQRKRCALGRLLLSPADLWLLDEPYSNLDHEGMAMVDRLLEEHIGRGGACIMSTHGSLRPEALPYGECVLRKTAVAA